MTSVTLPPEPDELDDDLLLPEFELLLLFPPLLLLDEPPPHAVTPRARAPATARAVAPVTVLCIAPPSSSPIPIGLLWWRTLVDSADRARPLALRSGNGGRRAVSVRRV